MMVLTGYMPCVCDRSMRVLKKIAGDMDEENVTETAGDEKKQEKEHNPEGRRRRERRQRKKTKEKEVYFPIQASFLMKIQ
jgi:hypothetical protein